MNYPLDINEKRLSRHPGSKCKIRIDDNGVIDFISYSTFVIRATPIRLASLDEMNIVEPSECRNSDRYIIECTGTYSQTTRRQISWFLREYFPNISYYDVKDIASSTDTVIMANKAS